MEDCMLAKNFLLKVFVLLLGGMVAITGCKESDSKKDKDKMLGLLALAGLSSDTSHLGMLKSLGVDTNVGPRTNPAGEEVPEDYNPTGKKMTQFCKRNEIFFTGMKGQGTDAGWTSVTLTNTGTGVQTIKQYYHVVLDWLNSDATNFTTANASMDDAFMATVPKTTASGDLDGDGVDEILVAYLAPTTEPGYTRELAFQVLKRGDSGYTVASTKKTIMRYGDTGITEYPAIPASPGNEASNMWYMTNFSAVCGDVDGNGKYETLIAFNGCIFILGDSAQSYKLLGSLNYTSNKKTGTYKLIRASAADMDNDHTDEFIVTESSVSTNFAADVTGTARYHLYKVTGGTIAELAKGTISGTTTDGYTTMTLRTANCAAGDIDGDGLNEILFAGKASGVNDSNYYIMTLKQAWNDDDKQFEYAMLNGYKVVTGRIAHYLSPACAIADFNGDGKKEVLIHNTIYRKFALDDSATKLVENIYPTYNNVYDCTLAVGDVDGDLRADIVYVSDGFHELVCNGFNSTNVWSRKGTGDIESSTPYLQFPSVTMGDYDGDSITVEFQESEILFTNPHPITVLASNPFWSGVEMSGSTSYGTATAVETETSNTHGFHVGFKIGYEADAFFGAWGVDAEASFQTSFDWTATESSSITQAYSYSTENEDKVIFSCVPFDVYYYKVIHHPNPSVVGTLITVNLPRKPIILPVERSYYNSHNGDAQDIDNTIMTHTIGNPLSYPTPAEAAEAVQVNGQGGLLKSDSMLTVGQGSGSTSIELTRSTAEGSSFEFSFEADFSCVTKAGGFKVGGNAGYGYGYSTTTTTSSDWTYSGEIGNIPNISWNLDRSFSWGLFTYYAQAGDDKFIVVQYFTESI